MSSPGIEAYPQQVDLTRRTALHALEQGIGPLQIALEFVQSCAVGGDAGIVRRALAGLGIQAVRFAGTALLREIERQIGEHARFFVIQPQRLAQMKLTAGEVVIFGKNDAHFRLRHSVVRLEQQRFSQQRFRLRGSTRPSPVWRGQER